MPGEPCGREMRSPRTHARVVGGIAATAFVNYAIAHSRGDPAQPEVQAWLTERDYTSVTQMKGSLSQQSCPDPDAFERANYMKALQSYTSEFA